MTPDFHHFSEIFDSDSNSGKHRFSYCIEIDSRYWNRFQNRISMIPIPIPAKKGIITPLQFVGCPRIIVNPCRVSGKDEKRKASDREQFAGGKW